MLRGLGLVARIAEDRMARLGKMHANLIAAAGFESYLQERRAIQFRDDTEMSNRELADRLVVG